jgi:hypothetical protein
MHAALAYRGQGKGYWTVSVLVAVWVRVVPFCVTVAVMVMVELPAEVPGTTGAAGVVGAVGAVGVDPLPQAVRPIAKQRRTNRQAALAENIFFLWKRQKARQASNPNGKGPA